MTTPRNGHSALEELKRRNGRLEMPAHWPDRDDLSCGRVSRANALMKLRMSVGPADADGWRSLPSTTFQVRWPEDVIKPEDV